MAALAARLLSINPSAMDYVGVVRADIVLRRATVVDTFVIIPMDFRAQVVLSGGIGTVGLLANTYGSIYDCSLFDADDQKVGQFFFDMPDQDCAIADLVKLTAWPMQGRNDYRAFYEIIAGTGDPFEDLEFGGYVTPRKYVLCEDNLFHVGAVNTGESATIKLFKNTDQVGIVEITSSDCSVSLNADEIEFLPKDVLRFVVMTCSAECSHINLTLVGLFDLYNIDDFPTS